MKGVRGDDLHTRKEQVQVGDDHVFEPHERMGRIVLRTLGRHWHEAWQGRGNLDASGVFARLVAYDHEQIEAKVGNVRERMTRIHRERREDGEDFAPKVVVCRRPLRGCEVTVRPQMNAVRRERGEQRIAQVRALLME